MTASRVEAVFEIAESAALTDEQKRRLAARHGERVTAVAQDARGQARNRELALERLREKLAAGLAVPRKRRATRPTQGGQGTDGSQDKRRHQPAKARAPAAGRGVGGVKRGTVLGRPRLPRV